jgi:TetR/AcrR family transcriptional repressor of nem operon
VTIRDERYGKKRHRHAVKVRNVVERRFDVAAKSKTNGQRTRARIVGEAAKLFNVRGYSGTSVAEISSAAGVEKGAIYNHFESKDALALASFEYAAGGLLVRMHEATARHTNARDRMQAMFDIFRGVAERRFIEGGCPILNTAVEADDTHPALSAQARLALDSWGAILAGIIDDGADAGEFSRLAPADEIAATIIAGLEGGVLLSNIYRDPTYMRSVTAQLTTYLGAVLAINVR